VKKLTDDIAAVAFEWRKIQSPGERQGIMVWERGEIRHSVPAYTTDLNIIVGEIERRGLKFDLWWSFSKIWHCYVFRESDNKMSETCYASTPAEALCAALMKFLEAKEK
jgi:hypothetical protein